MDHTQFKSSQTAAAYVAHELTEHQQAAFELHMMACSECLNDVESWRVIKHHMPAPAAMEAAKPFKKLWWGGWGMAASFIGTICVSATAGWFVSSVQHPNLDSSETAIFNMPALTRGEDCTKLPLAANTRAVVLRVPGVDSENRLKVTDMDGRELANRLFSTRLQRDGSWVVRFEASALANEPVQLITRSRHGMEEPLGCVSAAVVPPPN